MGASSLGIFVRLACVKHAASVRPEPGSNSLYKFIVRFIFWLHFVTLTIFRFRFLSKPPSLLCKVLISKSFDFEPTLSSFSRYCLIFKDHCRISDFSIISHRFPFVKYFFRFFQILFTRFTFPPWQLYHYITFFPLGQAFFDNFQKKFQTVMRIIKPAANQPANILYHNTSCLSTVSFVFSQFNVYYTNYSIHLYAKLFIFAIIFL